MTAVMMHGRLGDTAAALTGERFDSDQLAAAGLRPTVEL